MPGIYIHIPFCRKVCYYCDYFFSAVLKHKKRFVGALLNEIERRRDFLRGSRFDTIYFGGGTPSVLSPAEAGQIFTVLEKNFTFDAGTEITFEANPDDLSSSYLSELKELTPVNRLSIGIQSFNDEHLKLMNRGHTSEEGIRAVLESKKAGFNNINIDLIYGIPGMSRKQWHDCLITAGNLDIPHLSAYHLGIEPKTMFGRYVKTGRMHPVSEETSVEQYKTLISWCGKQGYEQYEISNYARGLMYSRHNLNYWKPGTYIGFGPSAHSYDGSIRQWNIANIDLYIKGIEENEPRYEKEELSPARKYNEYILTTLRTKWGADLTSIGREFGEEYLERFEKGVAGFINNGEMKINGRTAFITMKGRMITDYILSGLMVI